MDKEFKQDEYHNYYLCTPWYIDFGNIWICKYCRYATRIKKELTKHFKTEKHNIKVQENWNDNNKCYISFEEGEKILIENGFRKSTITKQHLNRNGNNFLYIM